MNLIEAGKIVNTHSVYGELKVQPWSDSVDFLCDFDVVYIDNLAYNIEKARVHKTCVLLKLEGVNNINEAEKFKNKCVSVDRDEVELSEGSYFIQDLEGMTVIDQNNVILGKLFEVLTLPANDVYVVRGEEEYMIPAVGEFIREVDPENKTMYVSTIPGMKTEKGGENNAD